MAANGRVAISIGDPAGIGCEITLKALAEMGPGVRPVIVGDGPLIEDGNERFGTKLNLRVVATPQQLRFAGDAVEVLHAPGLVAHEFKYGEVSAANGRLILAYADAAIHLALDGIVGTVVAAPQNQSSIRAAGIAFDGYSSFFARTVGLPDDDVYLMLVSERFRIAHLTTHLSVRDALARVRRENIVPVIEATQAALRGIGIDRPRIAVSGVNPHASENGLFGHEEAAEIQPAIAQARSSGIDVEGPFGADVMFARGTYDGYIVMLHDQGHIPAKLQLGCAAFAIGGPFLFASVAHGSAHDIAGRGIADSEHMRNAIRWSVAATA